MNNNTYIETNQPPESFMTNRYNAQDSDSTDYEVGGLTRVQRQRPPKQGFSDHSKKSGEGRRMQRNKIATLKRSYGED